VWYTLYQQEKWTVSITKEESINIFHNKFLSLLENYDQLVHVCVGTLTSPNTSKYDILRQSTFLLKGRCRDYSVFQGKLNLASAEKESGAAERHCAVLCVQYLLGPRAPESGAGGLSYTLALSSAEQLLQHSSKVGTHELAQVARKFSQCLTEASNAIASPPPSPLNPARTDRTLRTIFCCDRVDDESINALASFDIYVVSIYYLRFYCFVVLNL
jgi:hypothetical protein